jgi:hypothetical protein
MKRVLLPLLCLAACADAEPEVAQTTSAMYKQVDYVAKNGFWNYSALSGDRGTSWREYNGDFTGWDNEFSPLGYGETYVHTIPFGPDPNHKPPTVYFRTTFWVADPANVTALHLDVMYDDGFVAYINGVEVKRASMPTGAVSYSTLASGHEADNSYVSFDISSARSALRKGDNVLAIEVHQASVSSSDLVMGASLAGTAWFDPPPPAEGDILHGEVWSYWDKGGDLGTAWRQNSFDASTWDFGPSALGYGETYLETTVSYGSDPNHKPITTYFRKQFIVNQPLSVTSLKGSINYDDGMVVYLNGTRIDARSMPTGTVTASTLALGHEADPAGGELVDWTAYKGLLVQGVNTIAVEVHQSSPSSSDLVFDLSLGIGMTPPPATPAWSVPRASTWKYWDQGGTLGTVWRQLDYDDSTWASGPGPLGYGESYLNATIGYGPSASDKYITSYFRRKLTFDLPAGVEVTGLVTDLMFDDGVVIYLNGVELLRAGMPSGSVDWSTLALGHEANNQYDRTEWIPPPNLVRNGENVLAVEVHQSSPSSSDLVFDLALEVQAAPVFRKYAGNPIIAGGNPDAPFWERYVAHPNVMRQGDGSWLMFYTGTTMSPGEELGRATSSDGISWALGPEPLAPGVDSYVLFDGSQYRRWTYYYYGEGLYYDTSPNGLDWPPPSMLVDSGYQASVILDAGLYRMWYLTWNGMGYATSPDAVTWSYYPSLVFDKVTDFTVIKDAGEFRMWFPEERGMRYATSPDGIHWTRRGLSLHAAAGEWDAFLGHPSVVRDGASLKMWYAAGGSIGYAINP